jgi:hypothetical protein
MANFLLAYLLLLLLGICMNPSINPISCTLPWKIGWEIVSSENSSSSGDFGFMHKVCDYNVETL